jgi:hypothetical protein
MIIEHKGTQTLSGGAVSAPSVFKIQSSAIAFKVLSSRLYNDKILAPMRELACNAYDAHVAAGIANEPFDFILPTQHEPMFRIKDHGIGLDDKGVKELYCTYFGSNKSNSNEFIGAMGLGSKSPFCYTEGFTVVSYYNGKKRTYDAHISEEGMPEAILLSVENTKEHNGLEVSFPVKPTDLMEFQNKARIALEFVEPKPNINLENFTFTTTEYVLKTERWGIRKEPRTHQTTAARAIQGMVAYNVGSIDASKTTAAQRQILAMPVDLFFSIGELEVAASRESLELNSHTTGNVLALINEVYTGLVDELKAKINQAQTAWEARLILRTLHSSPLKDVVKEAEKSGELFGAYDKFTFSKVKPTINEMDYENMTIALFEQSVTKRSVKNAYSTKKFLFKQKDSKAYELAIQGIQQGLHEADLLDVPFEVEPDMLFVLNDIKFGGEKYIHYLLQKDELDNYPGIKRVYLLTTPGPLVDKKLMFDDAARFKEKLGNPVMVAMSTLKALYGPIVDVKKPTYSSGLPRERKTVLSLKFTGKYSSFFSRDTWSFWTNWAKAEEKEFDPKTNFYLALDINQKPILAKDFDKHGKFFKDCENMVKFLEHVRESGFYGLGKKTPIFGLKESSKLIGQPEWIELSQYIVTKTKQAMTTAKQTEMALFLGAVSAEQGAMWSKIYDQRKVHVTSPAYKFALSYEKVSKARENEALKNLAQVLEKLRYCDLWKVTAKMPNFEKEEEEVLKQYPMLKVVCDNRYRTIDSRDMEKITEYIMLVDEINERKQIQEIQNSNEEEMSNVAVN